MEVIVFRILPWWVFAFIAILIASPLYDITIATYQERRDLFGSIDGAQPEIQDLSDGDALLVAGARKEFRVRGIWTGQYVVLDNREVPRAVYFIAPTEPDGLWLGVIEMAISHELNIDRLDAMRDENGMVVVGGFEKGVYMSDIRAAIEAAGLQPPAKLYSVELYYDDRGGAIREKAKWMLLFNALIGSVFLFCALSAIYKFHRWCVRAVEKREQKRKKMHAEMARKNSAPTVQNNNAAQKSTKLSNETPTVRR